MNIKQVIFGLATFIPGVNKYFKIGTGGTESARYCYSVWLRHLVLANSNGLNCHPKIVAELGPGDSLGIGLAALISGAEQYFAFDIVEYANVDINLEIFEELVLLFRNRTNIPGPSEFPRVKPYLESYDFPHNIFNEKLLNVSLNEDRIEKIRQSITNLSINSSFKMIEYKVPWYDANILDIESIDLIFSQAVLEHVDELSNTYKMMKLWLKPNGYMSHQIDFKCHGTSDLWNGHWKFSGILWKMIRGNRPYLINRMPYSAHRIILEKEGLNILTEVIYSSESDITLSDLAEIFKNTISEKDLNTSGAFIQAGKSNK